MKDTVHPIRHPSVHPRIFVERAQIKKEVAHGTIINLGADKTPDWAERPHFFVHVFVPKVIRGSCSAQLRGDGAEYLVRTAFRSRRPQ